MSLISFADRDLFMWHRGGGVRHHEFKPAETIKITTEEIEEEEAEDPDVQPKEENEEELEHEMIDYGYEEDNDDEEEDEKADEVEEEQGATKEIGTQMEDKIADALKGLGLNIDEDGGNGGDDDDDNGGLGPKDGEFEGEEEDYCGYPPL